jgi:type I restriction enzyme M protein
LRGPVDAADFKTYIFPLLFFKRICDVWDEEYQEIVDETGDEQLAWFPESHRFQIPEDCHWGQSTVNRQWREKNGKNGVFKVDSRARVF